MGVQPGQLTDLLGFSVNFTKLQEVLSQLLNSASEQDAAIKLLREDLASSEGRLAVQDAALGELRAQQELRSEASEARFRDLGFAVGEMRQASEQKGKMMESSAVDALLQEHLRPLLAELGPLPQRLAALEAAAALAEAAVAKADDLAVHMEASAVRFAQAEAALEALAAQLQEHRAHSEQAMAKVVALDHVPRSLEDLSSKVAAGAAGPALEEQGRRLEAALERLRGLEERVEAASSARAALDILETNLLSAQAEAQRLGDEFAVLAAKVSGDEQTLAALQGMHAADVRRLDAGLQKAQADLGSKALLEKLQADLSKLTGRLNMLAGQLDRFLSHGSAAVSNCLCCSSKTPGIQNKILVGTDGKTYFQGSGGRMTDLGRLSTGLPANLLVPRRKTVNRGAERGAVRPSSELRPSASAGAF